MNLRFTKHRSGSGFPALIALIMLILTVGGLNAQTITQTFTAGDLQTLLAPSPTTATVSNCPGVLNFVIPAGNWVTGVSTSYNMTALGGGQRSQQRSYLFCQNNNTSEAGVSSGLGTAGTQVYARNNLGFANGATGNVLIQLRAFRTSLGSLCNATYNKVDGGTWVVTVSYAPMPTCMQVNNLAASGVTSNAANLNWTAPATGTAPIEYLYELRTSGAVGSGATGLAQSGSAGTALALPLTGLNASTSYTAYIRANCGGGDSSSWRSVAFTTVLPPCNGQPVAGIINGNDGNYTSVNFTLNLSGNSNPLAFGGLSFQWQRSATGLAGSWANIAGATGLSVTTSQTVSNYYRAYVVCAAASMSDTTAVKKVTNYCRPTYTYTNATHRIGNVTFGAINNTTTDNTVNDFTALSNNVVAGVANNISTTTYGYTGSAVAADLNNDGDFADADEIIFPGVYTATEPATNTYAITIPGWVATGSYRLRVYNWGGNSSSMLPCGTGSNNYGSFRDYTINVTNNATCMPPSALNAGSLNGTSATVGWTASTTSPGGYEWKVIEGNAAPSGTGVASGSIAATATSVPVSGLIPLTQYTFYIRSDCGAGNISTWNSITFTTTSTPCTAQPAAGTVTGPLGSYTAVDFTLNLSGNSNPMAFNGLAYQWQRSASGLSGSWANIAAATGVSVTTNQNISNYYRAYVVCTAAGLSDTTPVIKVTNYCRPTYTNTSSAYRIGNVTFGTINNTTTNNTVYDFTNLSTNVVAGVANNISTTTYGSTGSAVAADLNNDGDFADVDEILFPGIYSNAGSPEVNTYAITVPGWVATGGYRLRVYSWGGNSGGGMLPCGTGSSNYGSFRDYTVNVTNNATCMPPAGVNTTNLLTTSVTLGWAASTSGPANYEWRVMLGNANPATNPAIASGNVTGATTAAVTGLSQNTAYSAYVRSICGPADSSAWSAAAGFTTPVSCFPVTALDVATISGNNVTFGWTAPAQGNPVVNYQYEMRSSGAAGSGAAGLLQTGFSSTNSQVVANLVAGTAYTFYVRTDCNAGDSSNWVFKTYLAPTYVPITITSYNQDVIAEGIAAAGTTTTTAVDNPSSPTENFAYLSGTYRNPASPGTAPTYYLPANGRVMNGVKYFQLAPYNQNNVTRLVAGNAFDTMKFFTPRSAKNIYVLAVSGSGTSTVNFKVLFSDGTAADFTGNTVNDWYGTFTNTVMSSVGRVSRTTNAFEGTTSGPNLYETALNLAATDTGKTITGIVATKTSAAGFLNIFGISIIPSLSSCAMPGALAVSGTTYSGTDVSWTGTAAGYQVSYGTQGTTADNGTMMAPQSAANAVISGLDQSTAYSVYVRALCGPNPGDTSFWQGPVNFTTPCVAPVIAMGTAADGAAPSPISSCNANDATITLTINNPATYNGNYDVAYTKNGAAQTLLNQSPVNAGGVGYLTLSNLAAGTYNNFQLTQTGQGCSTSVLVSPVTIDAYTVAGLPAANVTVSATQPSGSNMQYATGACEPLALINATSGNLGTVTASVTVSTATTFNGSPYVGRHYDIAVSQANGGAVTLYFTDAEIADYNTLVNGMANSDYPPVGPNGENLKITAYHSAPGSGGSGPYGYSITNSELVNITGIVHNTTAGRWEVSFTTSGFSGFFAHSNNFGVPLKITLFDISATNDGPANKVNWITQTETPGDHFEVEHSADARNFSPIGSVPAKGIAPADYFYTDKQPFEGVTYYRLKMTGKDGRGGYSKTVVAIRKTTSFTLNAYPNPVSKELSIKITGGLLGKGRLLLTDVVGRQIAIYVVDGSGRLDISMASLNNGIYLLKYDDGSNKQILKITKQ